MNHTRGVVELRSTGDLCYFAHAVGADAPPLHGRDAFASDCSSQSCSFPHSIATRAESSVRGNKTRGVAWPKAKPGNIERPAGRWAFANLVIYMRTLSRPARLLQLACCMIIPHRSVDAFKPSFSMGRSSTLSTRRSITLTSSNGSLNQSQRADPYTTTRNDPFAGHVYERDGVWRSFKGRG